MKIKLIFSVFSTVLLLGCEKEDEISPVNAAFDINNIDALYIQTSVEMTISGEGQKFVIWPGDETHVWSEQVDHSNTGISTEERKTFSYIYRVPASYTVTCVASSTGEFGQDFNQDITHLDITVSDSIKSFNSFSFFKPKAEGEIVNDSIFITICDTEDLTDVRSRFSLSSMYSSVTVDGVPQVSRVTRNDFTKPVSYTITAFDGSVKDYPVIVTTVSCE